jgi:hypothetical protein
MLQDIQINRKISYETRRSTNFRMLAQSYVRYRPDSFFHTQTAAQEDVKQKLVVHQRARCLQEHELSPWVIQLTSHSWLWDHLVVYNENGDNGKLAPIESLTPTYPAFSYMRDIGTTTQVLD